MVPSATTINENGKHWQWAMFFEGIVFEGEGRSPMTDGVKLGVINARNVRLQEKEIDPLRGIASLRSGVNQP